MCVCVGGVRVVENPPRGAPLLGPLPSSTGSLTLRKMKFSLLVFYGFHRICGHHVVGSLTRHLALHVHRRASISDTGGVQS